MALSNLIFKGSFLLFLFSVFYILIDFVVPLSAVLLADVFPPVANVDWSKIAEPDEFPETNLVLLIFFLRS